MIGPPKVINKTVDGKLLEPYEVGLYSLFSLERENYFLLYQGCLGYNLQCITMFFCWQCLAIARKLLDTSDEAILKSYGLVRCMSLSAGTRGHHITSTHSYICRAYYILLYYFYYFSLGVDSIYIWCK